MDKSIYLHQVVGEEGSKKSKADSEEVLSVAQPVYYQKNDRDINQNESSEEAQGYLSEFPKESVQKGFRGKPLGGEFGKPTKLNEEVVVESSGESKKEMSSGLGRDANSDEGVY